jgi:hypothetical protein
VKRSMLSAALALTVAGSTFAAVPALAAKTATTAKSSKDSCASKPTKWQRYECENYTHSAPGDEYFGRLKLSYLGINNTFRDETIRAGDYTTDSGIINRVNFADQALEQWAKKYPNDPQLARTYFLAIRMYKKIYTKSAQQTAWEYMRVLTTRFGNTYFGKLEKADLSRGFTEHYFANPQLCPTPLPSGIQPETTPNATPTPMPPAGEPHVQILQSPCVKPSPLPTEEPTTAAPTPTSTASPA